RTLECGGSTPLWMFFWLPGVAVRKNNPKRRRAAALQIAAGLRDFLFPGSQIASGGQDLANTAGQDRHPLVDLFGCGHQGGAEGDPVRIEAAQQPVLQRPPADLHPEGVREAFLRLEVLDELDALEQPLAADVADDAVPVGQAAEAGPQTLPLD